MRIVSILLVAVGLIQTGPLSQWTPLTTGTSARLRGVSAVSDRVAWASGTNGTVIRTADGGLSWQRLTVPGADKLDFRDVDAVSEREAFVLSIGPGEQSRIYKTRDTGATWIEQFVNTDPKAFFDAMAFWDETRGVAISDSVNGQFVILTTTDGGATWTRVPAAALPPALPNEGFFAASGTNVAVLPPNHVWVGTGAASESRVLRSSDGGRTWALAGTPLASGPSSGIFSIAFADPLHGIVVGGDYKAESAMSDNAAVTADGGATWTLVKGLSGFRSAVAYQPANASTIVAVGPSGADVSRDGGKTWAAIPGPGFHAFSFVRGGTRGFGVGEQGTAGALGVSARARGRSEATAHSGCGQSAAPLQPRRRRWRAGRRRSKSAVFRPPSTSAPGRAPARCAAYRETPSRVRAR
jgi:photosystem II stability/assembly factor-like uncharacterized protein